MPERIIDTQALKKPERSLKHLLRRYCGVSQDKVLQQADWRLRLLPPDMMQYARADAHYLLFLSDVLQVRRAKILSNCLFVMTCTITQTWYDLMVAFWRHAGRQTNY